MWVLKGSSKGAAQGFGVLSLRVQGFGFFWL